MFYPVGTYVFFLILKVDKLLIYDHLWLDISCKRVSAKMSECQIVNCIINNDHPSMVDIWSRFTPFTSNAFTIHMFGCTYCAPWRVSIWSSVGFLQCHFLVLTWIWSAMGIKDIDPNTLSIKDQVLYNNNCCVDDTGQFVISYVFFL